MSAKTIIRSHCFGALFLLPALVMVLLHGPLGVSNSLLLVQTPADLHLREYNLFTIAAIYLGGIAFILHSLMLARDPLRLALAKVAGVFVYCTAISVLIAVMS